MEDPQNFPVGFKWSITTVNALVTLAVALASSTYAGAALDIAFAFRERNEEIVILGESLMLSLASMFISLTPSMQAYPYSSLASHSVLSSGDLCQKYTAVDGF